MSVPMGTTSKFKPPTGCESMTVGGVTIKLLTRFHIITVMKEYEGKSLEELRLEDYTRLGKNLPVHASVPLFGTSFATSRFPSSNFKMNSPNLTPQCLFGSPSSNIRARRYLTSRQGSNPTSTSLNTSSTSWNTSSTSWNTSSTSPNASSTSSNASSTSSNASSTSSNATIIHSNPFTSKVTVTSPTTTTTTFTFSTSTFTHSNPSTSTVTFSNVTPAFSFPNKLQFDTGAFSNITKMYGLNSTNCAISNSKLDTNAESPSRYTEATTQTEAEISINKFHQDLKEMLLSGKYSDFILNVRGQNFKVHKIILAAHSPVFAAMFEHDTKDKATGVVNIDDFESVTFSNFLNFIYGRVENINSDNVLDLYQVSDKYQVTELTNLCVQYMKNNISIENFCDIMDLSLRHYVWELIDAATQFFLQNSNEIALTAKWAIFLAENPVAGNELFLKALGLKDK